MRRRSLDQPSGVVDGDQDVVMVAVVGDSVSQEPAGIFRCALFALDGDVHPGDGAFEFLRFGLHRCFSPIES